jgi:hypothetical protein
MYEIPPFYKKITFKMYEKFCVHFKCIFYVQAGDLQLMILIQVLVLWPDDDPSLGSKQVAI